MDQEVLARCEMMKLSSVCSCMRQTDRKTETERHTNNEV